MQTPDVARGAESERTRTFEGPKRPSEVALAFAIVGALGMLAWLALNRVLNVDEIEAVHSAWLVQQGGTPYFDFFQHHHPALYYLLAPLIEVGGETVSTFFAARGLMFAAALGILALTFRLARLLFDRWVALAAVLLLGTCLMFGNKAVEVRPDVPMTLCGLASVYLLQLHGRSGGRRYVVGSAVCAALAFLFLQKAVFLVSGMAVVGLVRVLRKQATWSDFGIWAGVFAATILPVLGYFASKGDLGYVLFLNWRLNLPSDGGFTAGDLFLTSLRRNTVLWVFFAFSLPALRTAQQRELPWLALCALSLVLFAHRPWAHYYMMGLPFVAVLAAAGLRFVFRRRPQLALAVLLLGCVPALYRWTIVQPRTNDAQVELMAYVLENTEPGDVVHDGIPLFNVFRADMDYFWFSLLENRCLDRYRRSRAYAYDTLALIEKTRPVIISDVRIEDMTDPRIANHYRQSDVHDRLWLRIERSGSDSMAGNSKPTRRAGM